MNFLDLVFYSFIFVAGIQILYFVGFFGRFTVLKPISNPTNNTGVSVIICAKNESENLQKSLPIILNQKYPNFEVVLINDASSDNTLDIIKAFAAEHNNIRIVDVKNNEAFWANKKYALTLGIKASKHNYLLFTNADSLPASEYWIQEMSACFTSKKSIVLGYGGYSKVKKSLLNKIIRFESLVTAIQYMSFAKIGIPYMGTGRNLAYTKDEFFRANGFINHMKIRSGEDSLFINEAATQTNTAICISENSFTHSAPKTTFNAFIEQKRRHASIKDYFKLEHRILLAVLYCSQLLFWLFAIALFITTFKWQIVLAIFSIRFVLYYVIFGISSKKLGEKDLIFMLPFLELFLMITQLTIFIKNRISKPMHWK